MLMLLPLLLPRHLPASPRELQLGCENYEMRAVAQSPLEVKNNLGLTTSGVWKLFYLNETSIAGLPQMRLLHRYLLYHCLQCQSITFHLHK